MSDDDLKKLVEITKQNIINKSKIPESERDDNDISLDCPYCENGLVINGFCQNCGEDV